MKSICELIGGYEPLSSLVTAAPRLLTQHLTRPFKSCAGLALSAALSLGFFSSPASAIESWNKDTLYYGNYSSPVWTSGAFDGGMYRNFWGGYLYASVWHNNGGWDTAIQGNYSINRVDNVKSDYWVGAKYEVWGSGSGYWYMGPKLSVNWQGGNNDGASGWWENYIVDRMKQTPAQFDRWIKNQGGWYLGEDWFSGIHYKFYRRPFSSWNQLWAVRQYDPGTGKVWTPVKKILEAWRYHGLPNQRVDSIRLNIETDKENNRQFQISDVSMPGSFN